MTIQCMFCGEDADKSHLEDVFPVWLCKKLAYFAELAHPGTQPTYENYTYTNLAAFELDMHDGGPVAGSGDPTGKQPSAYLLPDVCQECNNGWMGRLEESVKRVLVGLIEGKSKKLAPSDQLLLTTWLVKTALTYDAARQPRRIPAEHGTRLLYARGLPLDYTQAHIGWDPNHILQGDLAHGRGLFETPPGAKGLDVYCALFCFQFNAVILRLMLNFGGDLAAHPELAVSSPGEDPSRHLLWPPSERFEWPTDEARKAR